MAVDTLEQLEEQERELRAKLSAVKKAIDQQQDKLNVTVGKAVLAEAQTNRSYKATLLKVLDKHVKGKRNRAMVGLEEVEGDHTITGD